MTLDKLRVRGDRIVTTMANVIYSNSGMNRPEITVDFRDCNMSRQINLPEWNVKWEGIVDWPLENKRDEGWEDDVSRKSTWLALPLAKDKLVVRIRSFNVGIAPRERYLRQERF